MIKNDFLKHKQANINVETKKCHDDAETSAFNVNIRLFMIQNCDYTCRGEKIEKLCGVMGVEWPYDPDNSYELTTDNLMKILAIHMRFR